jgi:S-adenosylmethionine:diacylglycerol 3-amino-3-carboxypropyl transferase
MLHKLETVSTPWRSGPFRVQAHRLLFGQTYEDCGIELRAFKPQSRVFAISGAGYTARALAAAGHRVTAVDIDPDQLAYAKSRAEGGPGRAGVAERLLAFGRGMARLAGWTQRKLVEFLDLSDCARQIEYWDERLDTPIWRAAVDTLIAPRLLGLCYAAPLAASVPDEFGRRIRQRLRRGWAGHPNRSNPYAAALMLGTAQVDPGPSATPIQFVCADAAEFLESCPPSTYDAFALSNIGDGASQEYLLRLRNAAEHAAAPNAVVVSRTFAEPRPDTTTNWAALDRSMLWGGVYAGAIATFDEGGKQCSIC